MELSLTLHPGDVVAVLPLGVPDPQLVVRVGRLGGAGTFTVLGSPTELERLGEALLRAAGEEQ